LKNYLKILLYYSIIKYIDEHIQREDEGIGPVNLPPACTCKVVNPTHRNIGRDMFR